MVSHLSKTHGIHLKSQGEAIAVKWKHTVEKQAWSCGFCINTFITFNDRLSHIASHHFERGQSIDDWDGTKVIQGLLQQSGLIKAWKEKLESLPSWMIPDIIWETDVIKDLQYDLEVGPSDKRSAVVLAEAAYTARRVNQSMENQRAMAVTEAKLDEIVGAKSSSSSPDLFHAPATSGPDFGFYQDELLSTVQGHNELFPGDPLVPMEADGYGSASMFTFDDSDDIRPAPSPFV